MPRFSMPNDIPREWSERTAESIELNFQAVFQQLGEGGLVITNALDTLVPILGDLIVGTGPGTFGLTPIDATVQRVLTNNGGIPTWAQVILSSGVTGDLPFSNIAQLAGLSVLGVTGNVLADMAAITAGTNHQVLRRSGTSLAFGAVDISQTGVSVTGRLPFTNIQLVSGLSVVGNPAAGNSDGSSITAVSDNQVLRRSGASLAFGAVNLASSSAVTGDLPFANLAQGSALSVLGVTGNALADNASIVAGTDHQVLRRSGTAVAFGAVNLSEAAATTGTLNHSTQLTNFLVDNHTQYVLLAGRAGGQVVVGGTAAADGLTLRATAGVGAGSEAIIFQIGNAGASEAGRFQSTGSTPGLSINTGALPAAVLDIRNTNNSQSAMRLIGDGVNANVNFQRFSADVSGAVFVGRKGRGTFAAPAQSLSGDFPMIFESRGSDAAGAQVNALATLRSVLTENTTSTAGGSGWQFFVVANGGLVQNQSFTLQSSGGVSIGDTTDPGDNNLRVSGEIFIGTGTFFLRTTAALNNGAGAGAGTITNAPAAGNPTKWIPIDDNGTTRHVPAW